MTDPIWTFFYDYVDPLSWILERDITWLEAQGVEPVARHPLELRAPPARMLRTDDPFWVSRWEEVERRAGAHGRTFARPALVPWTRKAHELALHARARDRFGAVHGALFDAYLEQGKDIGRVDVLVALAAGLGLDATETKAVLDVDRYAAAVDGLRGEAERLGVRGVPTLLSAHGRLEEVPSREALRTLLAGP
jgi:predicted DsbA family dithiol-disulfide isomerase